MKPQIRLTLGLITLLLCTVFLADIAGLLPRTDDQIRQSRKILGESLAVQLSSAVANGSERSVESVVEEIVRRDNTVLYAALILANGEMLSSFGTPEQEQARTFDFSSYNDLVIPIFQNDIRWGEARLTFEPTSDWGLRYVGIPVSTLIFAAFLAIASFISFYLFMRKALAELNPTKAIPERVSAAFDVLAEGVLILDENERVILANQSIATRIGQEPENMAGKNPKTFGWDLSGDDVEELPWQTALKSGIQVKGIPLKLQVDDEQLSFTVNASPIEDSRGVQKGVLITFDDVTPLESKNAELASMLAELNITQKVIEDKNRELEMLATSDSLTGCLNRRSFMHAYGQQYQQVEQERGALSVLMLDIDHFKRVNDKHGHLVGDETIKLVAETLKKFFNNGESLGRYGGEEFVVSIPGKSLEDAIMAAEEVGTAVSLLVEGNKLPMEKLTVSIGAASFEPELSDHIELLDRADRALYQAKQTGRNQACRFDPSYVPSIVNLQEDLTSTRTGSTGGTTIVRNLKSELQSMQQVVQNQAEEITFKSMHDDLTGLPNRFLFMDRMEQAIKFSDRNDNITAVVSICLSAHSRICNDIGYECGDLMISQAAQRVEKVVRSVDAIGVVHNEEALTFSRIADNEFGMLIVDLDSVESVPKIISRVTRALEMPFNVQGHEIVNHVHCGISLYPHDGREPELLTRNASLARSHAQRRSPHSDSAYFSKDIDTLAAKNATIATALLKAIAEDGLDIAYQPKVDSVSNRVTGVEALARWHHPELGRVAASEFIHIAENIGVISQVTDWILSRVCDDVATGKIGGLRVSINVSPLELHDPLTADRILNIIRTKNVSPEQLEIEIPESCILNNFELARDVLGRLQDEGLLIVLDDFGTAYSSLNLLLEIPVDIIKVDRSFVAGIQNAQNNRAVVRAIVQMAKAMNKRVVAEGVETFEERDCLLSLGCREVQGFFYARPQPFPDLCTYIEEHGMLDLLDLTAEVLLDKTG